MWENTNFRARGRGRGRGRFFRGRGIAFSRGRGWCGGSAPIAEVPPNNTISDDRPLKITVQTEKETARDDHNARRDSKHSESRDFAKGRSKSRSRSPISKRPLSDRLGHQVVKLNNILNYVASCVICYMKSSSAKESRL